MGNIPSSTSQKAPLNTSLERPIVVVVLGGPGSGKGTQCAKIGQMYGFTHISSGEVLRAEAESNFDNGPTIKSMLKGGKIVPPEIVIGLITKKMDESGSSKFLFDGFPRCEETRAAFENATNIEPDLVLFFDCPEEVMETRLLSRNEKRDDDTMETIKKRFIVHKESTLPVIEHYKSMGKVHRIDATRPVEDVFEEIKEIFWEKLRLDVSNQQPTILKGLNCYIL